MPYEALGSLSGLDRDAIMTLYSAFSNDPDALDRAVTEDWQDIPLAPGQGPGREAMKPMIRVFNAAFPDARITVHEIISVPGKAAVRAEITVALTLTIIAALKTFDLVYVTTGGGPGTSTTVPSYEVYRQAFVVGEVGAAAAVGVVLTIIIFAINIGVNRIGDRVRT